MKSKSNLKTKPLKKALKTMQTSAYIVNIRGTLNNMIYSLNALNGDTLFNLSCGACDFAGSKKASSFATLDTGKKFIRKMKKFGVKEIHIILSGIRRLKTKKIIKRLHWNFGIKSIQYPSIRPHNGCKAKKRPRS